jgi:probable F420-dependent oxidoreductase
MCHGVGEMTAPTNRPFRFGLVTTQAGSAGEWKATARRAEAAGYSTLLVPDTAGPMLSPLPALAVAAASTSTLRIGTWVLANDFRNPVLVARDAATLDLLSDGRFELGLGAGRPDNDYASLGLRAESGGVRVGRLAESVRIIDALFRGERVTANGSHYSISEAVLYPQPARRVPILLAAAGRRSLELAGERADIVAFGAMSTGELSEQVECLRAAAGERFPEIERSMSFWVLPEGDEGVRQRMASMLKQFGMDLDALIAARPPRLLMGSTATMAEQVIERRETFGLSYLTVDQDVAEAFAPVVERLAGR